VGSGEWEWGGRKEEGGMFTKNIFLARSMSQQRLERGERERFSF